MVFILAFLTSFLISYILTPHARNFAIWLGSIDRPGARRIHQTAVPSSGGMAIFLGFLLSVLIYSRMNQLVLGILLGGFFIFMVGLIDDLYEISPRLKLLGQVVAAVIPLLFGVNIAFITNPMGGMFYLGYWGIPLTVLWIVGITNTVNLIDGLDGLAAGISVIAALTLFLVGLQESRIVAAVLSISLAASSLGFLKYNFNPAEIFMGDAGSMFLGYNLAVISVIGALKSAAAVTLVVPVLVLGIPILDTLFAIIRRLSQGKPIGRADRGHIHHRLLALGWTQTQSVLIVYFISMLLGVAALVINGSTLQNALLMVMGVFLVLIIGAWKAGIFTVEIPQEEGRLEKGNF